jgi:hypothetical protein
MLDGLLISFKRHGLDAHLIFCGCKAWLLTFAGLESPGTMVQHDSPTPGRTRFSSGCRDIKGALSHKISLNSKSANYPISIYYKTTANFLKHVYISPNRCWFLRSVWAPNLPELFAFKREDGGLGRSLLNDCVLYQRVSLLAVFSVVCSQKERRDSRRKREK